MVDKIPTMTTQIGTSDMMTRTGQNYKINKRIWELIEEQKEQGGSEENPTENPIDNPGEDNTETSELFLKSFFDELTSNDFFVWIEDDMVYVLTSKSISFVEKDFSSSEISTILSPPQNIIYAKTNENNFSESNNFLLNVYENNTLIKENILIDHDSEIVHNIDIHLKPFPYKIQVPSGYRIKSLAMGMRNDELYMYSMENNSYILPQTTYLLIYPETDPEINSIEDMSLLSQYAVITFNIGTTDSDSILKTPDMERIGFASGEGLLFTHEINNDTIIISELSIPNPIKIGFDNNSVKAYPILNNSGPDMNTEIPLTNGYFEVNTEETNGLLLHNGGTTERINFLSTIMEKTPDANGIYQYKYSDFEWEK